MSNSLIRSFLIVVLILWGILFFTLKWLKTDEPLSQEATDLLAGVQLYDPNLKHDPYFYTLGFDARADVDPEYLGQLTYQQGWEKFNQVTNDETSNENKVKQRELLKGQFFNEKDSNLLKKFITEAKDNNNIAQGMWENRQNLQRMYQQQNILNQRFQHFLRATENKKPLIISAEGDVGNYLLILRMHYLYLSNLVFKQDLKGLERYSNLLLKKMSMSENLIEKIILTKMFSHNIDVLNEMNRRNPKVTIQLQPMNIEQLSMRRVFSTEFASAYTILERLEHQGLFDVLDENGQITQRSRRKQWWLDQVAPYLFLKNTSNNLYAQHVQQAIQWSELNNLDYKEVIEKEEPKEFKRQGVKNYLGQKIISIAYSDWRTYIVRTRLLNQKIYILNTLMQNRHPDVNKLNQNTQGFKYYQQDGKLCIQSPDPQTEEFEEKLKVEQSCLKI